MLGPQAQELKQTLERAEKVSSELRDEASRLRAKGELLRIERDSSSARVTRLEEEGRERETARQAEKEEVVSSFFCARSPQALYNRPRSRIH